MCLTGDQLGAPKPKLASDRKAPAGPIQKIMHDVLEPQRGSRVALGQAYWRYSAECRSARAEPVTPDPLMDAMAGLCKVVGMKTQIEADKLYLMNVRVTAFDGRPAVADDREGA